jgi:hypothetical protein
MMIGMASATCGFLWLVVTFAMEESCLPALGFGAYVQAVFMMLNSRKPGEEVPWLACRYSAMSAS